MNPALEVLVIEDDQVLRQQVAQLISIWGFHVRTAVDGRAGIDAIAQAPPDIVVSDFVLPGADGTDILKYIREHHPHMPVLMMTAYASLEGVITALKQGAYDYLLKPITAAELEAALVRATTAVQLQRARQREVQLRHVTAIALTLAHEINNPLAMIMGELQLQLESGTALDEPGLSMCLDAARRIASTIRALTDLSDVTYESYAGIKLLQLDTNR